MKIRNWILQIFCPTMIHYKLPAISYKLDHRSGQIMILTVLALGGTILGATTIAGLLMLYQVRQATDIANSTKAIYASDAGIEWALFNALCGDAVTDPCRKDLPGNIPLTTEERTRISGKGGFSNGATLSVTCEDIDGNVINRCASSSTVEIKSVGSSGGASRAFLLRL